jgi:hypothetical protein
VTPELLGPYRLQAEIGAGGMGRVFRAEVVGNVPGLAPGTPVAIKVFHPHLFEVPGFFRRFLQEGRIGVDLVHPNVVRTYGCDAVRAGADDHHLLVMELVEGRTLRQLLHESKRVPEELCRRLGVQAALGLQAIHEAGLVHRDMKPENVVLTPNRVFKVMDLGVARLRDAALGTSPRGRFAGSLEYAAPEQFRGGGRDVDGRTDLYALGVTLYELCTGRHPFRGGDGHSVLQRILHETPPPAGRVNAQVSPFFEEVLTTLLAKAPEARFACARDLAEVLREGEASRWWRHRAVALRADGRAPLRRAAIPRATSVHGREAELGTLRDLFRAAERGEGQVVLLEGEAGVGKTRLVDEFVARLEREPAEVNFLFGTYPPGGAATGAGALCSAYREHFGQDGLESSLSPHLPRMPHAVRAFAALLRGDPPPSDGQALTKEAVAAAFVEVATSLARERPTILLVEDLHFAPEEGRALFAALAAAAAGARLLLIGTMRRGVPATWVFDVERLAGARRMPLRRLWPAEVHGLLREALRSDRLAAELGRPIAHTSGGNPLFAFELLRCLRDEGVIREGPDGAWCRVREHGLVDVPTSLADLVRSRVAGLSESDREILDVAACCGPEFDAAVLARVVGTDEVPLLRRLAALERDRDLVRARGHRFAFDHPLVQELLHATLPGALREAYHASIGAAMEAIAGAASGDPSRLDGALCVDLCEHFLQGARGPSALRYLPAALAHLERGHVDDVAVGLCDRALRVPDLLRGESRVEVLLHKCARLEALGREPPRAAAIREALAVAQATGSAAVLARVQREGAHVAVPRGSEPPRIDDARRDASVRSRTA